MYDMRLFCKNGWFHVEVERNRSKALKTKDPNEAAALFAEMCELKRRGKIFDLDRDGILSLKDFKKKYLEHREGNVKDKTYKQDELSLRLLSDVIGVNISMRAIVPAKIDEFKKACKARDVKTVSINAYLRHIKSAFSWAVDEKIIKKAPKIKLLKDTKRLPRYIPPDKIKEILEKIREKDVDLWRYFMFLLWTGARRSEALAVQWQDIDFKNSVCVLRETKDGEERIVPLAGELIDILNEIKKDIGRVFIDYHPDTLTHFFSKFADDSGIKARLHDLRHSAATYMLKSGIPLEVVQEILGHADISTTRIYGAVLDEVKKAEIKKLRFE